MTNWSLDAQPEPRLLALPAAAASLDEAHAAIELWEFYSGKKLDSTQRLTVEVMMATRDDGSWAAMTTGREMPRQNGKGDEIEVPEFWGLIKLDEAILHTVHDAVLLATQAQERMLALFDHKDLRRLTEGGQVWKGTGQQMIKLSTGGQIWYRTRTGGGGRGVDKIDRLVVDEAQHATHEQLASVSSTMMAAPDPQMNAVGTAALEGKSAWWWNIRKRALKGDNGAFGYVGHTAENVWIDEAGRVHQEAPDVEDREVWRAVNPAIHAGRGQGMSFLEEELENLGPGPFAQEHLCVWAPPAGESTGGAIDSETWNALAQVSEIESHRQWAVACSSDLKWSSIGVAGRRADGKYHVEWMEHRAGTGWLLDRIVEGWEAKRIPIRIHSGGAEKFLISKLRERGVEVDEVSTSDYGAATGDFISAAYERQLVHLDQPSLNKALAGAVLKVSESGSSVWSEKSSSVEITPLKAVTVALGGVPNEQTFTGDYFADLDDFDEED